MNFAELTEQLSDRCTQELIYKTDYDTLKSWANNLIQDEIRALEEVLRESLRDIDNSFIWELSVMYVHEIPGKLNKISKIKILADAEAQKKLEAINKFKTLYDGWIPINEKLQALKPKIIKGKRPSSDPRKTPPRTLENTGTCTVCSQNCKLNAGKIVLHGFIIRGQRIGRCFGVDYEPIEISPKGAIAYRDMCALQLIQLRQVLLRLQTGQTKELYYRQKKYTPEDPNWKLALDNSIRQLESEIRITNHEIDRFNQKIEHWQPRPLPQ